MEVRLPEIEQIIKMLLSLESKVKDIERKISPSQEYYDLRSACELKGLNYNTVVSKPRLYQPNHGKPDAIICGRKRWRRETVLRWIEETDDSISEK